MTYPLVQFVSAPDPSAEVRYDFNAVGEWADENTWPEHEGFSLGRPALEGDPDGIGVEYGFRELSFNHVIEGPEQGAVRLMRQLAREILRRENWLRFQFSAGSDPVWFKTYRSQPGELDFEDVSDDERGDLWGIGVTLTAAPFAYGERVTLPTVTIANDPTAATNPASFEFPEILGDTAAPLAFGFEPSVGAATRPLISTCTVPDNFAGPYVWQAEDFTAVSDTGAVVSDAAYLGGGYRPIPFGSTTGYSARADLTLPVKPAAGRYKILARVATSDASSEFDLGLEVATVQKHVGQKVRIKGTAAVSPWLTWVDLGDFELPPGAGSDLPAGLSATSIYDIKVSFFAGRASGSGTLRFDAILAVPVKVGDGDAQTLLIDEVGIGQDNFGMGLYLDGDQETTAVVAYTGVWDFVSAQNSVGLKGSFPQVIPGERNVMHFLLHVDTEGSPSGVFITHNSDDRTVTTDLVKLSYQPRYLWLGGE